MLSIGVQGLANALQNCGHSLKDLIQIPSSGPPAPHLLGTNMAPSALEASAIRHAVLEAKSYQARLHLETDRLQAVIGALSEEKESVSVYISEHEALLSPARKILPEILSEIFLWGFEDDMLAHFRDAPFVLGQVCSYWRSVAISTPRLWSSILLHLSSENAKSKTELVKTAMARSGACLLHIDVVADVFSRWDDGMDFCLNEILLQSHRWKSVTFCLPMLGMKNLSRVKNAIPMLEQVAIYPIIGNGIGNGDGWNLDAFEVAPRLHEVDTPMHARDMIVPWDQVYYFSSAWHARNECFDWFRRCPNLVDCNIVIRCNDLPNPGPPHLLTELSRLTKLHFDAEGGMYLGDWFDGLVVPSMKDFSAVQSPFAQWAQQQFLALITRSSCTLTKIQFTGIAMTDDELLECIAHIPSLTDIIIYYNGYRFPSRCPITDKLLQRLVYRPPKHRFLPLLAPRLEAITFSGQFALDDGIFGDMVCSRWRVGVEGSNTVKDNIPEIACLKSVGLSICRDLDPKTKARLHKYETEGLHLDLSRLIDCKG
jgi:hypothetical protein